MFRNAFDKQQHIGTHNVSEIERNISAAKKVWHVFLINLYQDVLDNKEVSNVSSSKVEIFLKLSDDCLGSQKWNKIFLNTVSIELENIIYSIKIYKDILIAKYGLKFFELFLNYELESINYWAVH